MRGYVTCKHCHGVGKTFKWMIFPKHCPYCNGMGYIWMDSTREIDEYLKNNIMKSYTDLEQSKKLAEILPIESADGFWEYHDKWRSEGDEWEGYEDYPRAEPYLEYTRKKNEWKEDKSDVPCWSLTALLNVLPDEIGDNHYLTLDKEGKEYCCCYEDCNGNSFRHTFADNPIDACYEMILKLHKLKML